MQNLGFTRSSYQADHLLLTPDTFVRITLPGLERGMAIVHTSPARGAAFTQYTVEFEAGGVLGPAEAQRFLYVLEGELDIGGPDSYVYEPAAGARRFTAKTAARAAVIEKPYRALAGVRAPGALSGRESTATTKDLGDGLCVRLLLPDEPAFDFAVNTMTYAPGASLPMVEIHVMEHGLVMLEGGGIYRLGDRWYPVTAGDFIWMAPYCPQWFGALGKAPAKYLIYKDSNRSPLV